jgi:hypothetical protein
LPKRTVVPGSVMATEAMVVKVVMSTDRSRASPVFTV